MGLILCCCCFWDQDNDERRHLVENQNDNHSTTYMDISIALSSPGGTINPLPSRSMAGIALDVLN